MSEAAEIIASPRQRLIFLIAALVMIGLWGWSLLPPIESWGNPNEDGFSYVPVFYTTLICLPCALFLLIGAIKGQGHSIQRARPALIITIAMVLLIALFLIMQYITDHNDGKILGIQIGQIAASLLA